MPPITGFPGKPTTQGKNERSHRTRQRFLKANKPQDLAQVQKLIRRYRGHCNRRRPHQSLNQTTPQTAWELLEHTPAGEPISLVVLEAKAPEYPQKKRLGSSAVNRADLVVSKAGEILEELEDRAQPGVELAANQLLVEVTRKNRQTYFRGYHVSLPTTYASRRFIRTITDHEFLLSNPDTTEVVLCFPLPMVALRVHGKFVASYSIKGIQLANPTGQWEGKAEEYRTQFAAREEQMPEVVEYR